MFAYATIMDQILALVARLMPCPSQNPSENGALLVSHYESTKSFQYPLKYDLLAKKRPLISQIDKFG